MSTNHHSIRDARSHLTADIVSLACRASYSLVNANASPTTQQIMGAPLAPGAQEYYKSKLKRPQSQQELVCKMRGHFAKFTSDQLRHFLQANLMDARPEAVYMGPIRSNILNVKQIFRILELSTIIQCSSCSKS